jgi:hypothetical protein
MTRLVARLKRIELDGDYAGVWVDVHANPPMGVFEDMTSKDLPTVRRALAKLVRESNVEDEDGQPIDLHVADGWKAVPSEFWQLVADRLTELFNVPKATSTESTTSSSGTTPAESLTTTPS